MNKDSNIESIHELLGYENIKIIQRDDMFSFSLDSMLLADFVRTKYNTKIIIDLGCGNGPIPLFLTLKTSAKIVGIEIQSEVADLALRSVHLNGFEDQIEIRNEDLRNIYKTIGANKFDIVTCNPPYFKYQENSKINKNDYLTIARHEVFATLEDIIIEAKRLLVDGGSFYLVHRVFRISDILVLLVKHNFALKRLRFIYSKESSNEALSVLLEAKKNKKADVVIEKPLYVYNDCEKYTEEVMKIFNFKSER